MTFSADELVALRLMFAVMDRNQNNALDINEIEAYAEEVGEWGRQQQQL